MNHLPEHRRVIHARTWARTWRPADFDPIERWPRRPSRWETAADIAPIERPRSPSRWETAADIALAVAIGVGLTLWMWEALA